MRRVKSRDTGPELRVRRLLHRAGFRYRLHGSHLPGRPDLVFASRRVALFVHGCFWHGHDCRRGARMPKANVEYWRAKIGCNVLRDARAEAALTAMGWRPVVVWECALRDEAALLERLRQALSASTSRSDSAASIAP